MRIVECDHGLSLAESLELDELELANWHHYCILNCLSRLSGRSPHRAGGEDGLKIYYYELILVSLF